MITKTCPSCRHDFPLGEARLDPNWNDPLSFKSAYAYCPHCGERLKGVHYDSVDLAKHLTIGNILVFFAFVILSVFGLATQSFSYIGPAMIGLFGFWLFRTSKLRDHRIVGGFLIVVAAGALYAFNVA